MDRAERERLRRKFEDWQGVEPREAVLALLDALDAAIVERDAPRAEVERYWEVLRTLEQRLSQGAPEISPAYTGWVVAMRNLARAALAAADMASDVTTKEEAE